MIPRLSLTLLLLAPLLVAAQFGQFFEHMFQGGGGGGGAGAGQQQRGGRQDSNNVPSNSDWYRRNFDEATCNKYLCPGTLACVDKPTHCPCPFPNTEEKFELHPDGKAICVSKSGKVKGLTARKVELARKGLL
ncbi:hypothetical protein FN846DRAFT_933126 [Sphaerosporella brunnea]|uniref:Long chronological lifespan protein 2 n=1 Tax=Sphaerosporella brunnea TaxID=1250544 RepID=A0A5J5F6U7_9PEZI|nr:hypothetical protein FN846DRAFT_933126 [Sphaerosporella brunnea]